jgi:hypothetical protein
MSESVYFVGQQKEKAKGIEIKKSLIVSSGFFLLSLVFICNFVSLILINDGKKWHDGISCTNGMMVYETVQTSLNLISSLPLCYLILSCVKLRKIIYFSVFLCVVKH